jgi:hypothetical protein
MTILATGARPDDARSGGIRPLIRVARQANDAFVGTVPEGRASRCQGVRAEDLDRCIQFTRGIGPQIEVFEHARLMARKDGVLKVA